MLKKLNMSLLFGIGLNRLQKQLRDVELGDLVEVKWNARIFMVNAGLVGNITGIFLTQKA